MINGRPRPGRYEQQSQMIKGATNIALDQLQNLLALRDTREETLRKLGEQKARQEIAKKMLALDEPTEKIASLTGLSLEEIQKLQ